MPNSQDVLTAIREKITLILLDRDGVINVESKNFIKSPDEWQPLPGACEAIAGLQSTYQLAICTNQSGVGRGLFSLDDLDDIHTKLQTSLTDCNARPVNIWFCPHAPDAQCLCRKPLPGLLIDAMTFYAAQPEQTLFIGDSDRDIQAGQAAGCHVALVKTGNGKKTAAAMPDIASFDDLPSVNRFLLGTND